MLGIDIYGNSTKLYTTFLPGHSKTRIEYDQNTNTWLVLLIGTNDTKCIVISPNKEPYSFDIHETISSGTCLYRNTLYYTKNGKICYCNINTKKASYMPCDVATDASLIQRRDNKFVICNGKTCYVYTKS